MTHDQACWSRIFTSSIEWVWNVCNSKQSWSFVDQWRQLSHLSIIRNSKFAIRNAKILHSNFECNIFAWNVKRPDALRWNIELLFYSWRPSRALFLFELLHLLVFLFFPTKMNLIYLEIAHSVWRFCTKIFVRSQIKFTSITSVCDFIYYEKDSLKVDTQRWSDMNTGEPVIVRKMLLGDLCG